MSLKSPWPSPQVLHWGINDWNSAPAEARPPGTVQIDDKAVQTPFQGGQHVKLSFPEARARTRTLLSLQPTWPVLLSKNDPVRARINAWIHVSSPDVLPISCAKFDRRRVSVVP